MASAQPRVMQELDKVEDQSQGNSTQTGVPDVKTAQRYSLICRENIDVLTIFVLYRITQSCFLLRIQVVYILRVSRENSPLVGIRRTPSWAMC